MAATNVVNLNSDLMMNAKFKWLIAGALLLLWSQNDINWASMASKVNSNPTSQEIAQGSTVSKVYHFVLEQEAVLYDQLKQKATGLFK